MRKVLTIAFVGMCLSSVALAGDSPQFRGPNRDGRFDEEGLLETWPESGPPLLWVAKGLGKGYSSPEIGSRSRCPACGSLRFNGAADFHRRKLDLMCGMACKTGSFNGAADFHRRK